jgi:hypothetical protein
MRRIYCYSTELGLYKASTLEALREKIQLHVNNSMSYFGRISWHGIFIYPCYSDDDRFGENPAIRIVSVNPVNFQVKFLKPVKK